MNISKFSDYMGYSEPGGLRIATVTVSVPFLLIFERTIKKVVIVRPAGSLFWRFYNSEQSFIAFEQTEFDIFGRTVSHTPGLQAETFECNLLKEMHGPEDETYKLMRKVISHPEGLSKEEAQIVVPMEILNT